MVDADFALFNVDQLVTVAPGCHPATVGPLGVIERGALASKGDTIVWVGPMSDFHAEVRLSPDATVLNPHGRTVLPGFVDAHTHPVFAGERVADFYARVHGITYDQQIETGIMRTVRATRAASEDALLGLAFRRAESFLHYGTTTIEAKSGYGLTLDAELKSLRVLAHLQWLQPLKVIPAFLGAHVVPADFDGDTDRYVDELIADWLPAARPLAEFCDVWSDEGAFTPEQCRRILQRANELGFALTAHVSEMGQGEGVRMATAEGALSVDHAVYLDEADIQALAASDTTAVLLPGTTFFLRSDRYAPARQLLDAGVSVALGTDFNPGTSCTQNMQFILTLAVLKLEMTAEEAIRAATMGGAKAVGLASRVGSLEPGKYCDLTVFRVDDYRAIPYHYAMNLAETVIAGGSVVVHDGNTVAAALHSSAYAP